MRRTCYAKADTTRAVVALVAPFAFLAALILALTGKGHSLADYPALISSGEIAWFPQTVGWFCFVAWIVRYFPPALTALWDGPCLISSDGKNLFMPGGHRISLSSIRAVTVQRGFFRKAVYLDRDEGRISVNLLFVRPASDPMLRSLAGSDSAST